MLAVSAGLSLGKEGPMVHIACCIGKDRFDTLKFERFAVFLLSSTFRLETERSVAQATAQANLT